MVLICVSLVFSDGEHLFMSVGPQYVIFGKTSIKILGPFLKSDWLFVCFLLLSFMSSL